MKSGCWVWSLLCWEQNVELVGQSRTGWCLCGSAVQPHVPIHVPIFQSGPCTAVLGCLLQQVSNTLEFSISFSLLSPKCQIGGTNRWHKKRANFCHFTRKGSAVIQSVLFRIHLQQNFLLPRTCQVPIFILMISFYK